MKATRIERLINANFEMQRHFPHDSPEAERARLENRELYAHCDRMGWSYATEVGGYFTIYPEVATA